MSRLLIWMGPALAALGLLMGVGGVVAGLTTGDQSLFSMLVLTVIGGLAGTLMHLAGRRARVELASDHISWTPVLGSSMTVPWAAVHHVEKADGRGRPLSPYLVMLNGQQIPINAIRKSTGNGGAWADAGYRDAVDQIVRAHQEWLRWRAPRGRR